MKRFFTLLTILVAVLLAFSCQKELPDAIKNIDVSQGGQKPSPTPTSSQDLKVSEPGQFGAKGGEQTITVTATAAWTMSKSEGSDWLTVKPLSGVARTSQVTLTAVENTSKELRTATLFVRSGELTKSVDISQSAANPEISLDTNNIEFASDSGSKLFNINSNASWTITSDQDWCQLSSSSGTNSATITVYVTENTSTSSRSATITVKAGDIIKTIVVTQAGKQTPTTGQIISLKVRIINCRHSAVTLDGDLQFMLENPDKYGNYHGTNADGTPYKGTYNSTGHLTFSSKVTLAAGQSQTFEMKNVVIEGGEGLGGRSPLDPQHITWSEDKNAQRNVMLYVNGSDKIVLAENMDHNIVFAEGGTFDIVMPNDGTTPTPDPTPPPSSQDRTFTVGGVTFKMIYVEGGTFTMGATDASNGHTVTLSSYSIGETEVTQALWQAVMGQKPTSDGKQWSRTNGLGSSYSAYWISWNDCQDFINKLNATTGEIFRLLTEAEWEFAARGGNKSRGYKYAGSNIIDNVAWYDGNSNSKTHNVATKGANELGLYDMSGNVLEWCSDWNDVYSSESQTNPKGPSTGSLRVLRGGGWFSDAGECSVLYRFCSPPDNRSDGIGFRLALQ